MGEGEKTGEDASPSIIDRFPPQAGSRTKNHEIFFARVDVNEDRKFASLENVQGVETCSTLDSVRFRLDLGWGKIFQVTIGNDVLKEGAQIENGVLYLAGSQIQRPKDEVRGDSGEKFLAMAVGSQYERIGGIEAEIIKGLIAHLTGNEEYQLGEYPHQELAKALESGPKESEDFTIGKIIKPETGKTVEQGEWFIGFGLEEKSLEDLKVLAEELSRLIQEKEEVRE